MAGMRLVAVFREIAPGLAWDVIFATTSPQTQLPCFLMTMKR